MTRLLKYLRPFRLGIAVVFVLVFLQSLAQLHLPNLMANIVDQGIARENIPLIWRTGGLMLLVALGGSVAAVIAGYLSAKISAGFGKTLRSKVFAHVEGFSLREFDKIGTASLVVRTTNDITQVQMVSLMFMRMVISAPMMCIGGIIMAVAQDARLSLILVVVIPFLVAVVLLAATKALPLFRVMQSKLDRLNLVLREALTGIRVIRAFNRVDYEKQRFSQANRDLTGTAVRVHRLMAFMMPFMMLTLNVTTIAVIWIGGHRIEAGDLEVGAMMAFIQYAMQILMSLLMMSMIFVMLPRAAVSAERVNEVLESVPEIKDPAEPRTPAAGVRGSLEFRDVTFSYPGAAEPALRNVSFKAEPGEVTAIIGGTGAGKSTLVSLIPRFYDVDRGAVLVDGVDIRDMTQADLRARIGLVPQKSVLFSGTVADNIRYGKEDAAEHDIRHAAETAQALDFIDETKDGFAMPVAQGGTNVSGGQKQRLSIARALVRRPEIYILDDSFSALDFRTDARLRAALRHETGDSTVLIVAQRVSTVMDADRIIVLADGRVAGMGTHRELVRTSNVYREIALSQLPEEEIA
ncbi:MAG: ABC transporter ATP-binding protein [Bacillota bacterium]|nr:ABC transporter ATP-binding protein [Bacillota bacterium]